MRIKTSYADFVTDWQKLIAAIDGDPDLADLKNKPLLEAQLAAVKAINARQKQHTAERQQATQELNAGLLKGKDVAIQLRAEVKSRIDPRAERLVHFDMKPIRKKPRKAKAPEGEPAPEPEAKGAKAKVKAAAQPETPTAQ